MSTTHEQTTDSITKVAAASFIGTLIEFFDFFLFGTASALIFNKLFFPNLDPLNGTLAAFGAFGAAFVARPLGGVLFGHFGDRLGRKSMLVLSLLMMGLSTAAIGLMPTYEQVGLLAPALLVLARVIQGLALGGEWGGAVLMAVEHAPAHRRSFYSSWPQCGVPAGLILATGSFYLVQLLPEAQMLSWGWRVPFLASALLVILGLYIRLNITETPDFKKVQQEGKQLRLPIATMFKEAPRSLLVTIMALAAPNIMFYMSAVFVLKFGSDTVGLPRSTMLGAICFASFIEIFTMPLYGMLADRLGTRRVLMFGSVITILAAYPIFWLIGSGETLKVFLALVIALPVCHAASVTVLARFIPEQFEPRYRYTGAAVGYSLGNLLHSGPVPFVAATLLALVGQSWVLSAYIVFGGVLSLLVLGRFAKRDHQVHAPRKASMREAKANL